MLCENCKKREANVRYTENINGRIRQINVCEECSKKLGIEKLNFNIPIDFSSFFQGFIDEFEGEQFMPIYKSLKDIKCKTCGFTFDEIANTGRVGCKDCYEIFESKLDPIIKRIQGDNLHVGRTGKTIDSTIEKKVNKNSETENNKNKNSKLSELQRKLKEAIQYERYEEAAKIRDEINKLDK